MACSDGDSFTIDSDVTYDDSQSFNGCYDASGTFNSETVYSLDGEEVDGTPVVYSTFELNDDHGVWVLAYFNENGGFERRCKDAAEDDSSTLHPIGVLQWDCKDNDATDPDVYPDVDAAVTITCDCVSPTPTPTTAPTTTPTSAPTLALTPLSRAPPSPSPELVTETASGEATPVGAIAGGVVAGVLVVGAIILAVLFKTGRLKNCCGGSRNTSADDVVAPASAAGSVPTQGTRVEATAAPTARQYPVAYQYPAAI